MGRINPFFHTYPCLSHVSPHGPNRLTYKEFDRYLVALKLRCRPIVRFLQRTVNTEAKFYNEAPSLSSGVGFRHACGIDGC